MNSTPCIVFECELVSITFYQHGIGDDPAVKKEIFIRANFMFENSKIFKRDYRLLEFSLLIFYLHDSYESSY